MAQIKKTGAVLLASFFLLSLCMSCISGSGKSKQDEKSAVRNENALTEKQREEKRAASSEAMLKEVNSMLFASCSTAAECIPLSARPQWLEYLRDDEQFVYAVGVSGSVSSRARSLSRAQQDAFKRLSAHSACYTKNGAEAGCCCWEQVSSYAEELNLQDGSRAYVTAVLIRYPRKLLFRLYN